MHDRLPDELQRLVNELSDDEKRELIDQLARSLPPAAEAENEVAIVARRRAAYQAALERLSKLPEEEDPYAHLGYSNEAHDKILYDLEQK
jgi:hypothetical protein